MTLSKAALSVTCEERDERPETITVATIVMLQQQQCTIVCIVNLSVGYLTTLSAAMLMKGRYKKNSLALVRKRTIPTERPPLVGEVSANVCG
jgi:hypothetical protein